MSSIVNCSRRSFLKSSSLAGGGLILGFYFPERKTAAAAMQRGEGKALNAFVRIGPDESVTVIVNHSEMGQGPYTSIPMIVAEELDADWSKVRYEAAPVDPAYNHTVFGMQMTGGSTSTRTEWERVRKAGAAARQMLISAAATGWKVQPERCRTEKGFVISDTGERASFGSLAEKASKLPPPQSVKTKNSKEFKLVGKPTRRLDTPDKTNGKAMFGLDVSVPGMLVAVVARPPVFGAKLKAFNADRAKATPGVKHVVQIDRGIAVVADGFWPAKLGREALEISWDEGPLTGLDSKQQRLEYAELADKPGAVARKDGDAPGALGRASRKVEAVYDLPYLSHATMEPMNCVADVRADRCEIWVGTQFQTVDRDAAAKELGLPPEQVQLHTMLCGGGFGRRAVPDSHFVLEAVQISKAIRAPVKVVWTREDDMQGGWYRPRAYHSVSAGLNAQGKLIAWQQRVVTQSLMEGTPFEKFIVKNGVDETCVEGASDLPYDVPNILVDWQRAPAGIPVLWWRSVGHSHTAFVVETVMDELALLAGKDPFEFRRAILSKHPRHKRVLEYAAEKAGWGSKMPEGRGRGIAVHEAFGSFAAHVAEVSVSKEGKLTIHRFVSAIDCGPVVNPDTIQAQLQSGVVFGLSAALYGEISFEKGRVKQRNFHDYQMLRMHEMPLVEAHIVPSEDEMGGVGEPGVPPVAPALANAIFAVTGKRIRELPIRVEDLKHG